MSNPCFFTNIENKTQRPIKLTSGSSEDWQHDHVNSKPEIKPGDILDLHSVSDVNSHWGDSYRRIKVSYVDGPDIGEFQLGTDDASFSKYNNSSKHDTSDDYYLKAGSNTELIDIFSLKGRGDTGNCSLKIHVHQGTPAIVAANNISIYFENETDHEFSFTPGDKSEDKSEDKLKNKLGWPLCSNAIASCGSDLKIKKKELFQKSAISGPILYNTDRSTSGGTWGAFPGILREIKKNSSTLISFRVVSIPTYGQEPKWEKSKTLLSFGATAGVNIRSWLIDIDGKANLDALLQLNVNELMSPIGKITSGRETFEKDGSTYECNLEFGFATLDIPKAKLVDLIFNKDFVLTLKEGTTWNKETNTINASVTIVIENA
ncbi:MAG: hypothetical protein OEV42_03995 [Deltaproteobacteria bacterium]|nr:hypothetical protein [Deltaproteobacteria bacterium]